MISSHDSQGDSNYERTGTTGDMYNASVISRLVGMGCRDEWRTLCFGFALLCPTSLGILTWLCLTLSTFARIQCLCIRWLDCGAARRGDSTQRYGISEVPVILGCGICGRVLAVASKIGLCRVQRK
jgi:hypothetical protein